MRRLLVCLMTLSLLVPALAALGHAGIASTEPEEGAVVSGPVTEVSMTFTQAVTPVADGFSITSASGDVIVAEAETSDQIVFRLRPESPLEAGEFEVSYEVTSADAHIVSGTFRFEVVGPTSTTSTETEITETSATDESTSTTQAEAEVTEDVAAPVATIPDDDGGPGGPMLLVAALGLAAVVGLGGWLIARNRGS